MGELKPCPFCGYEKASLRFRQSKYFGQNAVGAKKIKFTGYIACNKCRSRSKPVSVVVDNVHCYGWLKDLKDKLLQMAADEWNRRAGNAAD